MLGIYVCNKINRPYTLGGSGLNGNISTNSATYAPTTQITYALNQRLITVEALYEIFAQATSPAIAYQSYIDKTPTFVSLTTTSIPVPTTETEISQFQFVVPEAGNYRGELYFNVNRTQDRRIWFRLRKKSAGQTGLGTIIANSQRNHFLNQNGIITTVYDRFRSQTYLTVGDIITVTMYAYGKWIKSCNISRSRIYCCSNYC